MSFWCLQFLPKNERKQVELRYHSSKVEFIRSFFGKIHRFRVLLTFSRLKIFANYRSFSQSQEQFWKQKPIPTCF